ncbi:MAG: Response regulator ArlR [Candidatus Omnitrophica bacterium]|nr:Response regulator ArlR [Candidatus Omnitrophota bacterium]
MAKILMVDDDQDLMIVLQSRLEMSGHEIETCSNGGDAYDKITDNDFDLVIMDYFMPSLKGDEVCQNVRENPKYKSLPILIITGFLDRDVAFFKGKGATDVIYKPIDKDELIEKINTLVGT